MRKKPFSGVSGIYTITNLINGKIYVGQTKDLYRRSYEHSSFFNKENHYNPYLRYACKKYGKKNLVFEVLVECDEEFLASEEHYWCNILNVHDRKYGYNILPTTPLSLYGNINKMSIPCNRVYVTVYKYGLDGNFIEEINDFYQYCRNNELYNSVITQAIKGEIQTAYGFQWRFEKFDSISRIVKGRRKQKFLTCAYQYDKLGNFIKSYTCAAEAANILNIPYNSILKCIKGKSAYAQDFIFLPVYKSPEEILLMQRERKLQGEDTILLQMDLEGNEIKRWLSTKEVYEHYKYNISFWRMTQIVRYSEPFEGYIWKTIYKINKK